jgi:hypothetical protein
MKKNIIESIFFVSNAAKLLISRLKAQRNFCLKVQDGLFNLMTIFLVFDDLSFNELSFRLDAR